MTFEDKLKNLIKKYYNSIIFVHETGEPHLDIENATGWRPLDYFINCAHLQTTIYQLTKSIIVNKQKNSI